MTEVTQTRAHIQLIAYIQILLGSLVTLTGAAWWVFWLAMGRHMHDFDFVASGPAHASDLSYSSTTYYLALLGRYAVVMIVLSAIPGIVAGAGMLKFKPWARNLGILVSVVDIVLLFPLHLFLGIYGLVILTKGEAGELFR